VKSGFNGPYWACPQCFENIPKEIQYHNCAKGQNTINRDDLPRPKITFADPSQATIINGLPLTVSPSASDLLAAVHFGFSQAVEMFRVVTQPVPMPQSVVVSGLDAEPEEELGAGVLDMGSLWRLDPVAREAILSRHGLQTYREAPAEPDVTAETMAKAIKEGGGIPPSEEE